jgi:hypothetical protein
VPDYVPVKGLVYVLTCVSYSLFQYGTDNWTFVQDMKYLDLESTRILKVDEIYPYSLQCDACQQIFIRELAAISIFHIPSTMKMKR